MSYNNPTDAGFLDETENPAEFERAWQQTESGPVRVREQPSNAPQPVDPPICVNVVSRRGPQADVPNFRRRTEHETQAHHLLQ